MVGADSETFSEREAMNLAHKIVNRQFVMLRNAVKQVTAGLSSYARTIVISGSGEFLARKVQENMNLISLADKLGPEISHSACAYSVAVLAQESIVNPP